MMMNLMIHKSLYLIDNQKKFLVGQEVNFYFLNHFYSIKFIILESQLQLAIINQMYYNDKKPEDIFGTIHIDLVHKMIDSIELWNTELPFIYSYSTLPSNFV